MWCIFCVVVCFDAMCMVCLSGFADKTQLVAISVFVVVFCVFNVMCMLFFEVAPQTGQTSLPSVCFLLCFLSHVHGFVKWFRM